MTEHDPTDPPIDPRIPVTVLTGFLGAGKTTLLNRLVTHPDMAGTALLINEFGAVGIDHQLVEQVGETMVLLESGCVCCTVRGDLVAALETLHDKLARRQIPQVRRVVIETTGLADPIPVVWTLMEQRYVAARFRCDGVVTLVDTGLGAEQLDRNEEARRQVGMADRILLTKADLADRSAREQLDARLDVLNPSAPRLVVTHGEIEPRRILGAGLYAPGSLPAEVERFVAETEAAARAGEAPPSAHGAQALPVSFTCFFNHQVPWRGFAVAMGEILAKYGSHLLRVKGLMNVAGLGAPVVVQCVEQVAYPPVRLPRWPKEGTRFDMRGRLVFIVRNLPEAAIDDIRRRLADLPGDAVALRAAATAPLLPTRCWLSARMPVQGRSSFETDAWHINSVRLGKGRPAAAAS
ncbi:cobalamin synthesis protein P47K [Xanthobacter versatilis]|uniref:Cobalamin synthesis protein P47K n=1 Tax=Xanthobacter autotrophicus (strain ATCC BAA-1158 / Py2) TaxID=78245 RepID=A7IEZ2_XANP2|nr:cobalamin synthesis protein P47K [Xanthobacter autotrophicus Py2]